MKVSIIDFGAGNLESVRNAVVMAGGEPQLARNVKDVLSADRFILPGVGAAGKALEQLRNSGMAEALTEVVRKQARPLLGICLGMQLIAGSLHEYGFHRGLGWIEGEVVDLHSVDGSIQRVPHMGWNQVAVRGIAKRFFRQTLRMREFYFCHTFTLNCADENIAATTDYGVPLVAAVVNESVFATQFHPEKSQLNGIRLIQSFLNWTP